MRDRFSPIQWLAGIVLLVGLVAFMAFVFNNGNLPVGPAVGGSTTINSIDVSQGGTVIATNIDEINVIGGTVVAAGSAAQITIPTATPGVGGGAGFTKNQNLPVDPATTPTACHGWGGIPNGQSFSVSNGFPEAGDTFYSPFYVEEEININCINLERASTGSVDCRVGIYVAGDNWQPGALEVDFGTITYNGVAGWYSNTVNHDLAAGSYLTAFLCNASQDLGSTFVESDITLPCELTTSFNACSYAWNVDSPSNTATTAFPSSGDAWDDWLLANNNSVLHRITFGWTVN